MDNRSPSISSQLGDDSSWRDSRRVGGRLVIEYDMKRMPGIGKRDRDAIGGDIEVYVKFHPGEVMSIGKVLKKIWAAEGGGSGPVVGLEPVPYEVVVPTNAHQVEVWFKGSTRSSVNWIPVRTELLVSCRSLITAGCAEFSTLPAILI